MADILVIRHGALGDVLQCFGPFAAIRAHHRQDRLTLVTGSPFVALAEASGLFDRVWADDRPGLSRLPEFLALISRLRAARFARVYDLQRKDRSALLFRLMRLGRPDLEWSGTAKGCSHPYATSKADRRHFRVKNAEQLAGLGIALVPEPDLAFLASDVAGLGLVPPYVVLVPGAAPSRPKKRWPAEGYAALAAALTESGLQPVLAGTAKEADQLAAVAAAAPMALNLCDRTGLPRLASLLRGAALAVGNDTGPMHLAAMLGCPSLTLFSADSDPVMTAPIGPRTATLQQPALADLPASAVIAMAREMLNR